MLLEIIFLAVVAALIVNHLIKILGREDEYKLGGDEEYSSTFDDHYQRNTLKRAGAKFKDAEYEEISAYEASLSDEIKNTLNKIKILDKRFDLNTFLEKTKQVFRIIIEAFNVGEKKTLEILASPKVYNVFLAALKKRENVKNSATKLLLSIKDMKVIECNCSKEYASIKVEIKSEQINYVEDKAGNLLEGSKSKIIHTVDIWSFTKNLKDPEDHWRLNETS